MTQQLDTIIVGAGLSGLTVAHTLQATSRQHRFLVLEKSNSTGGVIRSHMENGFIAESGPHGFLDNCKESVEILKETGLDKEAIKSPLIKFVRYVYLDGALRMIPQTPLKILRAPLIPFSAKLRVLADLWKPPLSGQPTVAKWVNHRFGSALLPFADAVFTGTYAGDINSLTIDGVMPGVRQLEKKHGSVIRGLIAKSRNAKKASTSKKDTFVMPAMTSFPQGMARLPERLTENLEKDISLLCNCGAKTITRDTENWYVETDNGNFSATNLVLALPTNIALRLLMDIDCPPPLTTIPEAKIATVVCGFGNGTTLPPGFGYLTPEQEGRFSLGTLFSSNMFPGRAPTDHILFETLVGGRRHPDRLELSDEELQRFALEDVREVLRLNDEPVYVKVLRPRGGIPQLEHDYTKLLQWRNTLTSKHPRLHICGFGWEGIGLNDMMRSAVKVAKAIQSGSKSKQGKAKVKGVYF